jgi:predicted regulator of amino acid metabolism with ACT domain
MWLRIKDKFVRQKVRVEIIRKMLECGIRTGENYKLFVGNVEVDYTAIARATGVDRRVVKQTVQQIKQNEFLDSVFSNLLPVGASLANIASKLGYSTIVIEADPRAAGVISAVTRILADHGIVIRQALADDPDMIQEAKLTLVVEGDLDGEIITQLESLALVKSITIKK